ncbi:MAG TPA: hypothetical protein DDZ99_07305 [Clostridiales bacterium]|nr:hypothetical protein [Clostridiales bacterium]
MPLILSGAIFISKFNERGSAMKELKFVQLEKGNEEHLKSAKSVWIPFIHEVNAHDKEIQTEDEIVLGLRKRIGIQGSRKDMHFEIVLLNNEVIGIAMFAIDLGTIYGLLEPGYGTVMGFYIKPEYRRRGYGKELYMHIEDVLKNDGTSKMYICPDAVTGVPFWSAMGFRDSGKFDPDDKKPIYIKRINRLHEIISVFTSEYLSHELAEKIALMQWHTKEPQFTNGVKRMVYDGKLFSDCFNVIATNTNNNVVGRLYCQTNQEDPFLWYYGDLAVSPEYRRQHIATKMLTCAISTLMSRGCHVLRTYVDPDNIPSIKLQKTFDFLEKSYKTFDNLLNEGQTMFELELEQYNVIPASADEARFVTMLYGENQEALHGAVIMLDK